MTETIVPKQKVPEFHHPNGGSSLGRRQECPGSFEMEKKALAGEETERSTIGTQVHDYIAESLDASLSGPWKLDHIEDDDVRENVEICLKWISKAIDLEAEDIEDVLIEEKLTLVDEETGTIISTGTADVCIVYTDRVHVVDWKNYMAMPNPRELVMQLLGYGASACQMYNKKIMHGTIYLPNMDHQQDLPETSFKKAYPIVRGAIANSLKKDAPLKTGKHCKWCNAVAICPKLSEETKAIIQYAPEFPDKLPTKVEMVKQVALALDDCSLIQLKEISKILPQIEAFAEAAKSYIKRLIPTHESEFPEWGVRSKKGKRSCRAEQLHAVMDGYLSDSVFLANCSVRIAELEKLWCNKRQNDAVNAGDKKPTQKSLKEEFKELTASIMTQASHQELYRKK